MSSSTEARIASIAVLQPGHFAVDVVGDERVTTIRGWCSTTWPSPRPSAIGAPLSESGRRRAISAPWPAIDCNSPEAINLGQQHRRRLQRLDLFFRIAAPRAILHDEHAERIAAAQNRHAEEGLVDFFARLRLVGEGRMVLRVGQSERLGARRDQADEALVRAHRRQMHGFALQALGGEQLQRAVGPRDIERAHLGHHIGGDQDDDSVEPRLRGDGLRHDLAKPSQQKTRSARATHEFSLSCPADRSDLSRASGNQSAAWSAIRPVDRMSRVIR